MMNLYVDDLRISTLSELKACFKKKEATEIGSHLFNELKELFIDDNLKDFFLALGENDLVERIDGIKARESDSEMMRLLIATITEADVIVEFDPMSCLEVVETTVKGNKAIFKLRVLKRVNEKPFEISISQPAKSLSKVELIDLSQHQQNDEIIVEMEINPYCDVCFWIGKEEKCRVNTESNAYRNCGTIEGIVDYLKRFPEGCHLGEIKA